MPRNTCEVRVGRLLEVRVAKGYHTPQDVDDMTSMMLAEIEKMPAGVKHVTIADWRTCKVMSEAACERATAMFLHSNPTTERSSIVCSESSPTAVWQFLRLVATGNNAHRRVFRSALEAIDWTAQVLSPEERNRLEEFLASPPGTSG
jgi:hypothetical protein